MGHALKSVVATLMAAPRDSGFAGRTQVRMEQ